jgi:hypothetical protein
MFAARRSRIKEGVLGPEHPELAIALDNLYLIRDEAAQHFFVTTKLHTWGSSSEQPRGNEASTGLACHWGPTPVSSEHRGKTLPCHPLLARAMEKTLVQGLLMGGTGLEPVTPSLSTWHSLRSRGEVGPTVREATISDAVVEIGTSSTTHVPHRPCRAVAGRSRSQPVHSARKCLL